MSVKSAACLSPLVDSRNRSLILTLIAGGFLLFALVAYVVQRGTVFEAVDRPAAALFERMEQAAPARVGSLNEVVGHFGNLGTTTFAIILASVWLVRGEKRKVKLLVGTVVTTEVLWLILIYLFDRERPAEVATILGEISLPGFPSGHTWMVMAFYSLLVYVYWGWLGARGLQAWAIGGVVLMTLINGFNRLFVASHYLTDVIASLGIGIAWTLGSLMVVDHWLCRQEKARLGEDDE